MKEKKTKKDRYVTPEMEVVRFMHADIITTSGGSDPYPDDNEISFGDFS